MKFINLSHKILLETSTIQNRVWEMGQQITTDYAGKNPVIIGIMKGSVIFLADLIRCIDLPLSVDFISISSYGSEMASSGVVRLLYDLSTSIEGKDVLLVEDIIDTGLTLKYLADNLATRHPSSLKICTLLDKKPARNPDINIKIDYIGFEVPTEFLVGYGLDYAEQYRNLPFIASITG